VRVYDSVHVLDGCLSLPGLPLKSGGKRTLLEPRAIAPIGLHTVHELHAIYAVPTATRWKTEGEGEKNLDPAALCAVSLLCLLSVSSLSF